MPKSLCSKYRLIEFEYNLVSKDATSCVPFRTLAFGKNKEGVRIEQSCNGLLLCSSKTLSTWCRVYYVYNPYTEQYKLIPRRRGFCVLASVSLAFDPSKSPYYKVISLRQRQLGRRIEIYPSQTSSLKNCGEEFQVQGRVSSSPGVYWNGSLNWMADRGILAYFDIDEEVIKHLTVMPYVIDGERKRVCYFDACRGHLQLIVQDNTGVGSRFDVLEVENAHTGWNLKYRIDLESRLKVSYPELVGDGLKCKVMLYDEVDTEGEGSAKLLLIQSPIGHGVISYDINNMQFKRIHNLEQPCILREECGMVYVRVHQYMGSLARV
ncbi:F-box protein At5g07610-like [Papaver somniferum]|uniref:F-box protein At5g07610-like n=1 Tax=Papaver somniferum TaxID=3469 RepID=UPI000E6F5551|nr:F-box protein At5g07610-like [Papaver somniferum]